jgi:hypothetical protein
LIRQQRIDVQLTDLRNVRRHLRQFDQNHRDGIRLDRRHIPVAAQQPRDAGTLDQVTGQLQIERRKCQRPVVDDLDRRAAAPEHDDSAEGRIVGEAEDQFARLRPHHHRLHDDAGYPRLRTQRFRPREDIGRRRTYGIGAGKIENDAADIGLVNDVARHDFQHHGRALRE